MEILAVNQQRGKSMIPFWPPIGLEIRGLIDYTVKCHETVEPRTKVSKSQIRKCLAALYRRDKVISSTERKIAKSIVAQNDRLHTPQ